MPPAFDWVTPQLAVGGRIECPVEDLVQRHRVGAVVDLRSESCDDERRLALGGLRFLHLPTDDLCAVAPPMLDAGVAFARRSRREDRNLLVHCQHGVGRSALLALCILVDQGMDPLAALASVKDARAQASPSPAQFEAWAHWLRRRGERPPDFEAFKAIAYRHLAGA